MIKLRRKSDINRNSTQVQQGIADARFGRSYGKSMGPYGMNVTRAYDYGWRTVKGADHHEIKKSGMFKRLMSGLFGKNLLEAK